MHSDREKLDRLEAIVHELAGAVAPGGPEDRAWAIINDLRAALSELVKDEPVAEEPFVYAVVGFHGRPVRFADTQAHAEAEARMDAERRIVPLYTRPAGERPAVAVEAKHIVELWANECHDISWRQHFDLAMTDLAAALTAEPQAVPEGMAARDVLAERRRDLVKAGALIFAEIDRLDRLAVFPAVVEAFQQRVQPWMMACFGPEISADMVERNHRFLEEALELVQSTGCTPSEAHQLVDYVFGRPAGETHQEVGGVMVTLAALCLAVKGDMHVAGETELARIWTKVDKIRAKHAAKPKHSPLPEYAAALTIGGDHGE